MSPWLIRLHSLSGAMRTSLRLLQLYHIWNAAMRYRNRTLQQVLAASRSFFRNRPGSDFLSVIADQLSLKPFEPLADRPTSEGRYINEMRDRCLAAGNNFFIGPEHSLCAHYVAHILTSIGASTFLEVGYQCGGLTIPVALSLVRCNPNARFIGIDNQEDKNAQGNQRLILDYLAEQGVKFEENVQLLIGDANEMIEKRLGRSTPPLHFDCIYIDHWKPLYVPCLKTLEHAGLISEDTIIFFHDIYTYARKEWRDLQSSFKDYYWIGIPQVTNGLGLAMKRPHSNGRPPER